MILALLIMFSLVFFAIMNIRLIWPLLDGLICFCLKYMQKHIGIQVQNLTEMYVASTLKSKEIIIKLFETISRGRKRNVQQTDTIKVNERVCEVVSL